MADKIVVIGLGKFGASLINELARLGYEVLAIDRRSDRVKEVTNEAIRAVQGDGTSKSLWEDLHLRDYRVGIVAFSSNVEANILTALLLRKRGVPHLIAKSNGDDHTEVLKAIGVDVVVQPEEELGRRVAHVIGANIEDYLDLADDFGIAKFEATATLDGKECGQLEDRDRVTVLVIRRQNEVIIGPGRVDKIQAGDTLVLVGRDDALRRLAKLPKAPPEEKVKGHGSAGRN